MPKKVLIIDDDHAIIAALTVRLRVAGHEVIQASSGQAGLAQAQAGLPDVIILDIRMPDIDGYEVCRQLKADPRLAAIPVIFVSANATETTSQEAYETGGAVFIAKPYEPKDILNAVESAAA